MVGVAQLVRAPGCGPGGRGFKSHHSPKFSGYSVVRLTRLLWEQEIGSSNLSTPTHLLLTKSPCLVTGAQLFLNIPNIFIYIHSLPNSFIHDHIRDTFIRDTFHHSYALSGFMFHACLGGY